MVFGFGKQAIDTDKWIDERIADLLSQKWDTWRSNKYKEYKDGVFNSPEFLNIEIFKSIILGAQLKLFEIMCAVSNRMIGTSEKLGIVAVCKVDSYVMDKSTNEWVEKSCKVSSDASVSGGLLGIQSSDSIAMAVGGMLDLDKNAKFVNILRNDFSNFIKQIGVQISQHKFI